MLSAVRRESEPEGQGSVEVYKSFVTATEYRFNPLLVSTGALQSLVSRMRSIRNSGDLSAYLEGYRAVDKKRGSAPIDAVTLRFGGRAFMRLMGEAHYPQSQFQSTGIGFAVSTGTEGLTLLRTVAERWQVVTDELLTDEPNHRLAEDLLDKNALLGMLSPDAELTQGEVIEALKKFSAPHNQAADHRFDYVLPGDHPPVRTRIASNNLPNSKLTLASIIE